MQCVANYEIKSECSAIEDDRVLRVSHPRGLYRARIQNIPRTVFTTPFLLSLHLYFDAPSLQDAQDVADDLLHECLNMLAFVTGCSFRLHRIRQLVDAEPSTSAMRSLLMWSEAIEYDDPQPFLSDEVTSAVERLSSFDVPPAIRRALRWYRLGINATVPDDQFMHFWFALEITAEYQKSSEKVPDRCPKCQSPLYCEACKANPTHKPYAKQAIRALLKAVDPSCDDATIERLDKTRNSLMHGSTLKEIEDSLPQPHEQIVDLLGRLLWRALVHQFPREMFDGRLVMGFPSTYVHRTANFIAHMQTVVPAGKDGDLDLKFTGMTMTMVPHGPPQSSRPSVVSMSQEQFEKLRTFAFRAGDHQELFRRIYDRAREHEGRVHTLVLATDMGAVKAALQRGDTGDWLDWFREVVKDKPSTP